MSFRDIRLYDDAEVVDHHHAAAAEDQPLVSFGFVVIATSVGEIVAKEFGDAPQDGFEQHVAVFQAGELEVRRHPFPQLLRIHSSR